MQLVMDYQHKPATTSTLVAERFGKDHKDVLKAIKNLECSEEFRERNFAPSSYKTRQNRDLPMYFITRDGFAFLVMGFTGLSAARFKEEYIDQFNKMEATIKASTPGRLETYTNRILSEPTKNVPKGYWSVFDRSHKIMLFIEKHIGSVNRYDIADGSIGRNWALFRKGQEWAVDSRTFVYEFDDNRGNVECNCYQKSEDDYFDDWLVEVYKPKHLHKYLVSKYAGEKNQTMLDKVNEILPKVLLLT